MGIATAKAWPPLDYFRSCLTGFVCLLLGAALSAPAAAADARGISVEPLPQDQNTGHAAVFVGVNSFEDDSIRPLKFAVNDMLDAPAYAEEVTLVRKRLSELPAVPWTEYLQQWDETTTVQRGQPRVTTPDRVPE